MKNGFMMRAMLWSMKVSLILLLTLLIILGIVLICL